MGQQKNVQVVSQNVRNNHIEKIEFIWGIKDSIDRGLYLSDEELKIDYTFDHNPDITILDIEIINTDKYSQSRIINFWETVIYVFKKNNKFLSIDTASFVCFEKKVCPRIRWKILENWKIFKPIEHFIRAKNIVLKGLQNELYITKSENILDVRILNEYYKELCLKRPEISSHFGNIFSNRGEKRDCLNFKTSDLVSLRILLR